MKENEQKFIKKQGLSIGRNIGQRSIKPKVNKGTQKKVVVDDDELNALKYLGYSHAQMAEMAAEMKKD